MAAIPDGFHVVGGRAERLARWQERRDERKVDELVARLQRQALNRGLCRHCGRDVGLIAGELVSVTVYHRDLRGWPCAGRGRPANP